MSSNIRSIECQCAKNIQKLIVAALCALKGVNPRVHVVPGYMGTDSDEQGKVRYFDVTFTFRSTNPEALRSQKEKIRGILIPPKSAEGVTLPALIARESGIPNVRIRTNNRPNGKDSKYTWQIRPANDKPSEKEAA